MANNSGTGGIVLLILSVMSSISSVMSGIGWVLVPKSDEERE